MSQLLVSGDLFANRFDIERVAGSGGMGAVYRARDRFTGDTVALKLLHAGSGSVRESDRFHREAQLLAQLRHPGIVSYVAHGQIPDGQRFLAMEWLDGEDLAQRLSRGRLSVGDALIVVRCIAEALALAHERGVVHRDLKPTNLFLPRGELANIKLLDFGIARRISTSNEMTRTGAVVGTPEYMAPEQAAGSRDVTPAADVFSLGCILYECLTGEPPFAAATVAAVLARILFQEPVSIEERLPGIAPAIAGLLRRMLAKDATQRIPDAGRLAKEVSALGELPNLPMMPTVRASIRPSAPFAEHEQVLCSVVFATPSEEPEGDRGGAPAVVWTPQERQEMRRALQALGVRAEFLASGALVVTVSQTGSATDQAAIAARAALLVKQRWSGAHVSLATGRSARQGGGADMGEALDRAVRFPRRPASSSSGIWVDELSAGLLDARFSIASQPEGAVLTGEEKLADASRPLLGKPTPCVGREAELGTLESQLRSCLEESEARAVLITAPPGVGKSRLRHEFLRRIGQRDDAPTVLEGSGDLTSAGAPYGILGAAVRRLCGLAGGESLEVQRIRLRARVERHLGAVDRGRIVPFLGELASIPFAAQGDAMLGAAREDPRIMRDRVRRAFLDWMSAECRSVPVVLVLDDLHWGDALSVGLVGDALRELAAAPFYVVALARPEVHASFPKLWQDHKLQEIPLKGLAKRASERLVADVLGGRLTPTATAQLIERSGGNALFLEELIRAAAEGKTDVEPETVVAMLQTRIGRFDAGARRLVLAASVFGQTFWRGGVAVLLGFPKAAPEVVRWLDQLRDAEVIQANEDSRLAGEEEFVFRHALVRDAAYGLLTDADRTTGHRLSGVFLEVAGERDPVVIAEHHERGGDRPRAAIWYTRAAERALDSYANEAALDWVGRGVACGADGELLGALRAQESIACFLLARLDRCFPAALEALPMVRTGTLAWARAMFGACLGAGFGPPEWQAQFPSLAAQLIEADPEREAEGVYVEALSHTIATIILVAPAAAVASPLAHLEAVCDRAARHSPALRRHLYTARGRCMLYSSPSPWQIVQEAPETTRLCNEAGDLRNLQLVALSNYVWTELGDPDRALALMGETETEDEGQEVAATMIRRVRVATALVARGNEGDDERAAEIAREALERLGPFPVTAIFAHDALSRIALRRGNAVEAEALARAGCTVLERVPTLGPNIRATLILALLAQGKHDDALKEAEGIVALLGQFGCLGGAEVELRLAISETFHAAGDVARARAELRTTLEQIRIRADGIADPVWRESYLRKNPYCARAAELTHAWAVEGYSVVLP
jgi:hypothetical protein